MRHRRDHMSPAARNEQIQRLRQTEFDVLVVGGGINGAVSAAALSARGLKVALVEAGDFAGETSSASSCMVWGGIKYLQTFEFGLVRNLCRSRNTLMQAYPALVPEVRYLAALDREAPHRPLSIFAGTWLYWLIGKAFTRRPGYWPKRVLREREPALAMDQMRGGVTYSDAFLPEGDAHFVFGFIKRAWKNGAIAVNYARALDDGQTSPGLHHTRVKDVVTSDTLEVKSRVVINAAGPWVGPFNEERGISTDHRLVFSKGIHLVVPKIAGSGRILTFFAADDRPFFVLPMGDRSCVGTTDTRVAAPECQVTEEDREMVLTNINRYLKTSLSQNDIVSERCGVRPLVVDRTPRDDTDWTELSRKHAIECDDERRFITILGGKLTDCLNIGDEVCEKLEGLDMPGSPSPTTSPWFGESNPACRRRFLDRVKTLLPGADGTVLWRRYGAEATHVLDRVEATPDEAREIIPGTGILECEVRHAAVHQMVVTLEDYFRRRTLLEMTRGRQFLLQSKGAKEICEILFGAAAAKERWKEYEAAGSKGL